MQIFLHEQVALSFLTQLNRSLLLRYVELKAQFHRQNPPNNTLINYFKWKSQLDRVISVTINEFCTKHMVQTEPGSVQLISALYEHFKHQQTFNELFKNINSTVETVKDFIRSTAIKDPASEVYLPVT